MNAGVRAALIQALAVAENNVTYHAQRVEGCDNLKKVHQEHLANAQARVAEIRQALDEEKAA